MSFEYVVVGRRPLPSGTRPWTFELDSDELDEGDSEEELDERVLDDGSLELYELEADGNEEYFAQLSALVGFTPRTVITIDPAAWDMSQIAAEVLADSLHGVSFVDGLVDDEGLAYVAKERQAAASLDELEGRILAAYRHPDPFVTRWQQEEAAAQAAREAADPEYRETIRYANDWSDVGGDE